MKVFITGATGMLGSALIPQLVAAGAHGLSTRPFRHFGRKSPQARCHGRSRHRHGSPPPRKGQLPKQTPSYTHRSIWGLVLQGKGLEACANDRATITTMTRRVPKRLIPASPAATLKRSRLSYVSKGVRALRHPPARPSRTLWGRVHDFIDAQREGGQEERIRGRTLWPSVDLEDAARVYVLALDETLAPVGSFLHPRCGGGHAGEEDRREDWGPRSVMRLGASRKNKRWRPLGFVGMVMSFSNKTTAHKTKAWLNWEHTGRSLFEAIDGWFENAQA
ncbi:uncharacterized protein EV422DRAFT_575565 [Fimicolochytrium jonesii]|uniref:uncharacterized protein n=1 Tax=Fimicolochytrium jonesii TaxID=1396493 RepID=UPI0022FE8AF2|nr:uncharacterized protein EV422DRAFT_575565 [Fimicolochytrium jonesii]KAI8825628.1 hypothetical protein EV422DRAFT_575565 [Fimicolochytrium jonesii]